MGIKETRATALHELEAIYRNARNRNTWKLGMLKESYIPMAYESLSDMVGEDLVQLQDLKEHLKHIDAIRATITAEIDRLNRYISSKVTNASGVPPGYRQDIEAYIDSASRIVAENYPDVLALNEEARELLTTYREISRFISSSRREADINAAIEAAPSRFP